VVVGIFLPVLRCRLGVGRLAELQTLVETRQVLGYFLGVLGELRVECAL
jgi:hypothetical protein